MTRGSISNHNNVISVPVSFLFLLVALAWLLPLVMTIAAGVVVAASTTTKTTASSAENAFKCTNLFSQPVTRESFMPGSQGSNLELVESSADFVQKCHGFQQFDQTKKAVMLSSMRQQFDMNLAAKSSSSSSFTVYIYDFRLVTGDVYIDLGKQQRVTAAKRKEPLVINLVARQFVTFNLFNFPSDLANVTILLSGECNLEVRSKQEWLRLNVVHAPVYDELVSMGGEENFDNTIHSNQAALNQRAKWMSFLSRQLGVSSETRYYVERLTMLCHVRHLFISPEWQNSVLVQYSDWNYEDSSITEYLLIKNCVRRLKLSSAARLLGDGAAAESGVKDEFYLFEFDSNQSNETSSSSSYDNNQTIRIYLKDCAFNKRYNLIVFFNTLKPPRMVLETDICRLNILYSNVELTDLFGVKWPSTTSLKQDWSKNKVLDSLGLKSYFHLKLVDYAAGIELRFNIDEETDKMIKNTHAFSNLLALQLFVDESRRGGGSSSSSKPTDPMNASSSASSIKFLVADQVIKAHFAFRNLNIDQFAKSENIQSRKASTRFVILDTHQQPCPLVYLRRDHRSSEFSLLFNSDLFDKCAIPYDMDLETYLLTLKFNFYDQARAKFHSSYFTIKAKHVDQLTAKTSLDHRTKMINQIRKRAKDEYFNSVIANTLESHYTSATELYTGMPLQHAKTDIELASLDDLVRWQLGACWLMSMFNCDSQKTPPPTNPDQMMQRRDAHDPTTPEEEVFGEEQPYDDTNHDMAHYYEEGDNGGDKKSSSQTLEFSHRVKNIAQAFDYKRLTVKLNANYEFNSTAEPDYDDTDKFLVCKILPCAWTSANCSTKLVDKQRLILINYFNSTHSPRHYYIKPARFFFDSSISFASSQSVTCLSNIHMIYEPPTNDTSRPSSTTRQKALNKSKFEDGGGGNSYIAWLKEHTLSLGLVGFILVCILVCVLIVKVFFKNFPACCNDMFKKRAENRDQSGGGEETGLKSVGGNQSTNMTHHNLSIANHTKANSHLIPTSLEMEDKEQSEKLLKTQEPASSSSPRVAGDANNRLDKVYSNHNDSKRNFVTNV